MPTDQRVLTLRIRAMERAAAVTLNKIKSNVHNCFRRVTTMRKHGPMLRPDVIDRMKLAIRCMDMEEPVLLAKLMRQSAAVSREKARLARWQAPRPDGAPDALPYSPLIWRGPPDPAFTPLFRCVPPKSMVGGEMAFTGQGVKILVHGRPMTIGEIEQLIPPGDVSGVSEILKKGPGAQDAAIAEENAVAEYIRHLTTNTANDMKNTVGFFTIHGFRDALLAACRKYEETLRG